LRNDILGHREGIPLGGLVSSLGAFLVVFGVGVGVGQAFTTLWNAIVSIVASALLALVWMVTRVTKEQHDRRKTQAAQRYPIPDAGRHPVGLTSGRTDAWTPGPLDFFEAREFANAYRRSFKWRDFWRAMASKE